MGHVLYLAENCHDCAAVLETFKRLGYSYPVYNVDLDQVPNMPEGIYAFPALCEDGVIISYGPDIIGWLERNLA